MAYCPRIHVLQKIPVLQKAALTYVGHREQLQYVRCCLLMCIGEYHLNAGAVFETISSSYYYHNYIIIVVIEVCISYSYICGYSNVLELYVFSGCG